MRHWLFLILLFATPAAGREVWSEGGFILETAGWADQDVFPEWTGVQCGLTLPPNGWLLLEGRGALELYLPGVGWVADQGIAISHGCRPEIDSGRDTRQGAVCITEEYACREKGNRVLMLVRIPKLFPRAENRPTQARWVATKVSKDAQD